MKQKRHLLAIALLMQAWAATGFAMKPLEEPADTAGRYSGVKMQKGEVITDQDFNNPASQRHRERAVTPGDFQPMATEAPGVTVQRAPPTSALDRSQRGIDSGKARGHASEDCTTTCKKTAGQADDTAACCDR